MIIKMKSKPKAQNIQEPQKKLTKIKQLQKTKQKQSSKGFSLYKMSKITVSQAACKTPTSNNTNKHSLMQEQRSDDTVPTQKGSKTSLKMKIKINSPEKQKRNEQGQYSYEKINPPFFHELHNKTTQLLNTISCDQQQIKKEIKQQMMTLNQTLTKVMTDLHRVKSDKKIEILNQIQRYRERIDKLNIEKQVVLEQHNINLRSIL